MSICRIVNRHAAIVLVVSLLSTALARAADSDADNRIDHLVVGDCYRIRFESHDVQQEFNGDFAKVTDRWIVLHTLSEGRNERGVPFLSAIPHINRLFKNVGIGQTHEYVWIPREAATIHGRLRATDPPAFEPPSEDEPNPGAPCEISFIGADHKITEQAGKLKAISADQLTLLESETVSVEVPRPGWSKVPVVGAHFTDTRTETLESLHDIARKDLVCIRIRVPGYAGPMAKEVVGIER
jgi:hypothetical protein